jgi:hypothetical protein
VPKPAQLNVLWDLGPPGGVPAIERSHYDVVLSGVEPPELFADGLIATAAAVARPSPAAGRAPAGPEPAA